MSLVGMWFAGWMGGCDGDELPAPRVTVADLDVSTTEDTPLAFEVEVKADDVNAVTLTILTPPSHGEVSGEGPGWTYTPAQDFVGTDTAVVQATEQSRTVTATVTIHVAAVNDAPIANADNFPASLGTPLAIPKPMLLANDTDVDGAALSVVGVGSAVHGTVAIAGDNVVFNPELGFGGGASFTYTISDGSLTATGAVTVSIGPNTAPVAVADAVTVFEDSLLTLADTALTANDSDLEHNTLTITAVSAATHGTVSHTGHQVTFMPAADYHGPASFEYTLSDGLDTATGTVAVTVDPSNDAPIVGADVATTPEDTALALPAATLLANDTDVDADPLTVTAVSTTPSSHGTVTLAGDVITYVPASNYHGAATITYTASDGSGRTASGTVTITVTSVNDVPMPVADAVATGEDVTLSFAATQLAANDTDADGDVLTVTGVTESAASHGSVTLGGGTVTYTPTTDFTGSGTFTYAISDGSGGTATGTVTTIVGGSNDAPIAVADLATTPEDTTLIVAASTLLANDSDPDGDPLTVTAVGVTANTHGTVSLAGTTITYTPAASFHGTADFSYTVRDSILTVSALVTVTVATVEDPPVAIADTAATNEDTALALSAATLLENDTDSDGDLLTVTTATTTATSHGTVVLAGTTITYTPEANYFGPATIAYSISDGTGATAASTVEITVRPINDAPVARDDVATTLESTPLVISHTVLLANDSDDDGDILTVTSVRPTTTTHGMVGIASNRATYTPTPGYSGLADFRYTISDGNGGIAAAVVVITVTAVNDAPTVTTTLAALIYTENDPATQVDPGVIVADVDSPLLSGATVQIETGCTSPQDALALTSPPSDITVSAYAPASCTLTLTGDATVASYQTALRLVTYANPSQTPAAGARVVRFTVTDHGPINSIGSGSRPLTVVPVNDIPVANADSGFSTDESTPLTIASSMLVGNDSDLDGDPLTVSTVTATANTHGAVVLGAPGGSITYTPTTGYHGSADFRYTVSDGRAGTATALVSITVININAAPTVTTTVAGLAYAENAGTVTVDPAVVVADGDSAQLVSATIQIVTGCAGAQDVLAFAGPIVGVTASSYAPFPTCGLTLTGPADVAVFQAAFRQVTYANTSEDPIASPARVVRFRVDDGEAFSNTGFGNRAITVSATDDPPVAVADAATVIEDALATAIPVLGNDTDADGGAKAIASITQPPRGTVLITGGGTGLTYQPGANRCTPATPLLAIAAVVGPETFTYTLTPGTSTATVTMTVTCVVDAHDDVATVDQDSTGTIISVLANDDSDAGPKAVASISVTAANGIATVTAGNASVTYTPTPGYCNEAPNQPRDTFKYTLNPGGSEATVSVSVTCSRGTKRPTDFYVESN